LYGTEAAAYWKGLKVQSEWIGTHVSVPGEGYNFGGYYVQLGYLLFGGNQRFNVAEGEFTSISPGKKWGDVELNLRYDYLDLNHRDVYGGSGENYTAGLNFYLGNSIKMAINYMYTSNDRFANGKGKLLTGHDATGKPTADFTKAVDPKGKGGVSYNSIAVRFEVNF
jgi:phosphate-selective porin OprO/OprP